MGDDNCNKLFLKVVHGVSRLEKCKARVEEARKCKRARIGKAESLDPEESVAEGEKDKEGCPPPSIDVALEVTNQEIEKLKGDELQVEKERKQIQDELEKGMAEMDKLKSQSSSLEFPDNQLWMRQIRDETSKILDGLKEFNINIQHCRRYLFPTVDQELQQVRDAHANYLVALQQENAKLKVQLKDLIEKEEILEAGIAVLKSEEELIKEAEKQLGMQEAYNFGRINNKKYLEKVAETKRESLLSRLSDLNGKGKEIFEEFIKLNIKKERK